VHLPAHHGHSLGLLRDLLGLGLDGLAAAEGSHLVDRGPETEEVVPSNPHLILVPAFVILVRSKVGGRLCLAVAGIGDHTGDPAGHYLHSVAHHGPPLDDRVCSIVVGVLLYPVVAGLVDHTVDLASCRPPDARLHVRRLVFRARLAAVGILLAHSLAVRILVGRSLDHTVHARVPRSLHNMAHVVGSYRIHDPHSRRVAGEAGHSPDRRSHRSHRSHRIAVAEGTHRSVVAPEPAGAGRSKLDDELRRKLVDYTPCCRSNGRKSSVLGRGVKSKATERASLNGSSPERMQ
jgi:hypothetical protein